MVQVYQTRLEAGEQDGGACVLQRSGHRCLARPYIREGARGWQDAWSTRRTATTRLRGSNPPSWTRSFRDRPATRVAEDWGLTSKPDGSEKGSPCAIARVGPRMGAPEGLRFGDERLATSHALQARTTLGTRGDRLGTAGLGWRWPGCGKKDSISANRRCNSCFPGASWGTWRGNSGVIRVNTNCGTARTHGQADRGGPGE